MAFNGDSWNETSPVNSDLANEIDDNMRDMKIAVRARMSHEHVWPSSQANTAAAGGHSYISFQTQTAAPTLAVYGTTGTAAGAMYIASSSYALMFEDSAGSTFMIASSAKGLIFGNGTGTIGAIPVVTSAGGTVLVNPGSTGYALVSAGETAKPAYAPILTMSGTGVTNSAVGFTGGNIGPTNTGEYYYLVIGLNSSDGRMMVISGATANGAAIPLPAGCPQANCHWIVSMKKQEATTAAYYGHDVAIDGSRVVTIGVKGNNWVG